MTVDIWIRDYNPPRCFQKKISGRGKHNGSTCIVLAHAHLHFLCIPWVFEKAGSLDSLDWTGL
jgi:hypothetical protein